MLKLKQRLKIISLYSSRNNTKVNYFQVKITPYFRNRTTPLHGGSEVVLIIATFFR